MLYLKIKKKLRGLKSAFLFNKTVTKLGNIYEFTGVTRVVLKNRSTKEDVVFDVKGFLTKESVDGRL